MLHSTAGHGVAEALGRLCDLAALRHPDDPLLVRFLPLYYSELPEGDVDERKLDDVYAVALAHLTLGRVRPPGQPVARVLSPDRDRDGWHSPHSVLLVVTDDMPFLVDTMRMVLERHGLGIHLLVHPMLSVERDGAHRLVGIGADGAGLVEAWTQIEIDRTDDATAKVLEADILDAIEDVRRAVEDFPAMRERMAALGERRPDPAVVRRRPVRLPRLGRVRPQTPTARSTLRRGSELGLARDNVRAEQPPPMPGDRAGGHRPHRRSRQGVPCRSADGRRCAARPVDRGQVRRSAGDQRLSRQRRRHPRRRHRGACPRSTSPKHGCTPTAAGPRATCSRTCPATSCWSRTPTSLAQLVVRHRRSPGAPAGAGLRGPRTGRALGHRARLPAAQPVHRRAARADRRRRGRGVRSVAADVRVVRRRQLTGPHRGQRAPSRRRRRRADPDRPRAGRRRPLDVVVRPPARGAGGRGRRGAWPRAVRAHRIAHAPAAYRAAVPPGTGHRRRPAHRLAARRRRRHDDRRRPRHRRRRARVAVPHLPPRQPGVVVGAAAAARPPRPRGARRAVLHVPLRRRAGVPLRHRRARRRPGSRSTPGAGADLQLAFAALVAGEVESDGFNRLVLGAGLTAREVAVVRAYGKYLRQIGFAFSQPYIEATLRSHPRFVADLIALFHARFDPTRYRDDPSMDRRGPLPRRRSASVSSPRSMPFRASTTIASAGCS